MQPFRWIDTRNALVEFCDELYNCKWVALDTEFIRDNTYYPQLCLIQLATSKELACIDPLSVKSLSPLLDILFREEITKVFHAAQQDLETFYHLFGELPKPVFDTQMAASMLGYGDQMSYAKLVRKLLGVTLDKSHSRTDWSMRPLSDDQIRYATDDVNYLRQLYPILLGTLTEKGRRDWLTQDTEQLYHESSYILPSDTAWRRIRGIKHLNQRQLSVLRALAAWREDKARAQNFPRKWIISDRLLLEFARKHQQPDKSLSHIKGMEPKTMHRYGKELLEIISEASLAPRSQWPKVPPHRQLTAEQSTLVDMMMALVRYQARLHEISSVMLATRNDLERLVLGDIEVPVLKGWRNSIAGNALKALLQGRLFLGYVNEHITVIDNPK